MLVWFVHQQNLLERLHCTVFSIIFDVISTNAITVVFCLWRRATILASQRPVPGIICFTTIPPSPIVVWPAWTVVICRCCETVSRVGIRCSLSGKDHTSILLSSLPHQISSALVDWDETHSSACSCSLLLIELQKSSLWLTRQLRIPSVHFLICTFPLLNPMIKSFPSTSW